MTTGPDRRRCLDCVAYKASQHYAYSGQCCLEPQPVDKGAYDWCMQFSPRGDVEAGEGE